MSKNLYTPKSPRLVFILFFLVGIFLVESFYLNFTKTLTQKTQSKREQFVAISGLPDLAISTEASFVRHRSMSDMFSIYKDDGSLREYFPSTYVYSHSHTINGNDNAKKN
jgi:ABC-type sugar transport system permease subunit